LAYEFIPVGVENRFANYLFAMIGATRAGFDLLHRSKTATPHFNRAQRN
jgi:hypothetical protein